MVEYESPFAVVVHAWLIGLTVHMALHFVILPTATKLWDFALGPKNGS